MIVDTNQTSVATEEKKEKQNELLENKHNE